MELAKKTEKQQLAELTTTNKPLFSFLRTAQGLSKPVTHPKALIKIGSFYISHPEPEKSIPAGERVEVNGEVKFELKCVVGPWRPHALLLNGDAVEKESFDMSDPVFQEIKTLAETKSNKGAMFGVDQLLFVPRDQLHPEIVQPNYKKDEYDQLLSDIVDGLWCIYFFAKSARDCAPAAHGFEPGTALRIRTTQVFWKDYNWWSPNEREMLQEQLESAPLTDEMEHVYRQAGAGESIEDEVDRSNMKVER